MPPITLILSACALVSAGLTIWADSKKRPELYRMAKPLTTVLIIAVAVIAATPQPALYKTLILAGLGFSLLGDIALTLPEKWFQAGLAAFLVAQVFYILAFKPGPGHPVSTGLFLPYIFYGLLMFFILSMAILPSLAAPLVKRNPGFLPVVLRLLHATPPFGAAAWMTGARNAAQGAVHSFGARLGLSLLRAMFSAQVAAQINTQVAIGLVPPRIVDVKERVERGPQRPEDRFGCCRHKLVIGKEIGGR